MGQRLNPISLRLNTNRLSDSKWFSKKNYGELISEDFYFRSYIENFLRNLLIPLHRIVIKRNFNSIDIFIYILENKSLRKKNFNFRKFFLSFNNRNLSKNFKTPLRDASCIKRRDDFVDYMFNFWYDFGPRDSTIFERQKKWFDRPYIHTAFVDEVSNYFLKKKIIHRKKRGGSNKSLYKNFHKNFYDLRTIENFLKAFFKKNFMVPNLNLHFINLEKKVYFFNTSFLVDKYFLRSNPYNLNVFLKNSFKLYSAKSSMNVNVNNCFLFSGNDINSKMKKKDLPNNFFLVMNSSNNNRSFDNYKYHMNKVHVRKVYYNTTNTFHSVRLNAKHLNSIFYKLRLFIRFLRFYKKKNGKNSIQYYRFQKSNLWNHILTKNLLSFYHIFNLIKKNRFFFYYDSCFDSGGRETYNSLLKPFTNEFTSNFDINNKTVLDFAFITKKISLTKSSFGYLKNVREFFRTADYLRSYTHLIQLSLLYQSASLLGSSFCYILEKNFNEQKGQRHKNILRFLRRNFNLCLRNHQKLYIQNYNESFLTRRRYIGFEDFFDDTNGSKKLGSFSINNSHLGLKLGLLFILKGKFRRDGKKQVKKYKFNLPMKIQKKTSLLDYFHTFIFSRFGVLSFKVWLYTPTISVNSNYKKLYQVYNFEKYSLNQRLFLLQK